MRETELKDGHVWVARTRSSYYHTTWCNAVQKADDPKQVPKETIPNREQCDFCMGTVDNENKSQCGQRLTAKLRKMDAAEVFDGDVDPA
jgi:hypothetical protein